jgi:hexosaminidase
LQDIEKVDSYHIDDYKDACDALPACVGFNNNGFLKKSLNKSPQPGVDLYVKATVSQPDRLGVLPVPVQVKNGTQTVLLSGSALNFVATTPSQDLQNAFARYNALMFTRPSGDKAVADGSRKYAKSLPSLTTVTVTVANTTVPLQLGVDESYVLSVPADGSSATITAPTVYGVYHALETLSQLVRYDFDLLSYKIPLAPLVITDAPRFQWRGLLIDTSRHFLPVRTIKNIIDSMTYAKMNVLHWHLVDSQSWPVQSIVHPLLWSSAWSPRERFTVADLSEVVEYARQRGVLVVPELDTPGHNGAMCTGYPEVCANITCVEPMNPANNYTFTFLSDVLNEWAAVFPSDYFHLGGDEVDYTCWEQTPAIAAWMQQKGFDGDATYEYFVTQVDTIADNMNKKPIRWEEVWNHFGTQLARDTIIHIWLDHPTLINVTASGYYAILSDSDVYYLDHLDVTWDQFYGNDLLAGIAPSAQQYVLGGETCMWGETADTSDVLQTIWPRAAAAAERQWSYTVTSSTPDDDVFERLTDFRCLLNARGIPAAPLRNSMARAAPTGPGSCERQ